MFYTSYIWRDLFISKYLIRSREVETVVWKLSRLARYESAVFLYSSLHYLVAFLRGGLKEKLLVFHAESCGFLKCSQALNMLMFLSELICQFS